MDYLKGKKTFIICAVLAIVAVAGLYTGNLTPEQFVQLLGMAGIGAGLRDGMNGK